MGDSLRDRAGKGDEDRKLQARERLDRAARILLLVGEHQVGLEPLQLSEVPDPVPGENDLLVRVRAAGVNRADILQRLGRYGPPPGEPDTLGLEIAGEVVSVGAQARGPSGRVYRRGDRVMALLAGGGYAELCRVPAAQAMPVPSGLDFAQAAAIPEAFLTGWLNLFLLGRF